MVFLKDSNSLVFAGLLIIAFLITGAPVSAAVLTIDDTQSVQTAVNTLAASPDPGDTLILNPGTYNENGITLSKNIRIQANTSFGHSAADTFIDGGSAAPRIFTVNAGVSLAIDNLTLQNGRGTNSGLDTDNGGAIRISGGTLTITSSAFTGCSAGMYGGAIYSNGGSTVSIDKSTFLNCQAENDGGAITNNGGTLDIISSSFTACSADNGGAIRSDGTLSVTSSVFSGCTATHFGGAIRSSGTATIAGSSTFTSCTAFFGGAIQVDSGTLAITGATITGCSADNGGAIYASGATVTTDITDTTFSGCTADYGGAIYNTGTLTVTSSTFAGCSATFSGGAIYNTSPGTVTISSSTFSGCSAVFGGAIHIFSGTLSLATSEFTDCPAGYLGGALYNHQGTATITSSTFSGCTANWVGPGETGSGGAIYTIGTTTITSSTFSGCSAASGGGAITNGGTLTMHFSRIVDCGSPEAYGSGGTADAENNWWGTNAAPPVGGNIDADPWLVLGITADPAAIILPGTSTVRANLTFNSDNTNTAGSGIFVPDAITNTFAMVSGPGSVSPLTDGSLDGIAQTTYTPGAAAGTANISATVDSQTAYVELPVTWPAPAVTAIMPNTGLNISVVSITSLTGSGFRTGATVLLMRAGHANITATGVTVVSPAQITCTLPITHAEAGAWDVVVINPDGQEAVLPGGFTITAPGSLTTTPTSTPPGTGETLSDFPSSPTNPLMTVTVNIGGDSKAWQAIVTGTKLPDLIVTGTVQHSAGDNVTAPPGIVFQYFTLMPARFGTITNAIINFTVPQSWLDDNHIAPGSIVLYHQTANGGWEALPTTVLYTKDGTVYYSAQSNGFSLFAIAGTPTAATPVVTATAPRGIMSEVVQTPAPAAVTNVPVTTQTTVPSHAAQAPAGSSAFPILPVLIGACGVGLVGGCWYLRRWWIRRQKPALFRESD
jgi:hypothetical protein